MTRAKLVRLDLLTEKEPRPARFIFSTFPWGEVGVEVPENFDFEKARGALAKKLDEVRTHLQRHKARYENEGFRAKADAETVAEVADKIQDLQAQERILESQLDQLS